MFAKGRIDLVVIYGFAAGVRSVASPQKWGRQSYRMDFTPSKIIAIKRALETNVKEEAKERMVAVHARQMRPKAKWVAHYE